MTSKLTRRGVLVAGTAAGLVAAAGRPAAASTRRVRPTVPAELFTLGVASGDPAPDGFVLWTRLAPEPLEPGGGMPPGPVRVQWQVAEDAGFRRIVRSGTTTAVADWAHSVHVEVTGLAPHRPYHYRFRVGGRISPAGRACTLPGYGSAPSAYRFAVVSCQDWQNGYYAGYRHIAEEAIDLVLHLGDYLYGGEISPQGTEDTPGYARAALPPEPVRAEPHTLEQYRLRHALYKTDPQLQQAHAAVPWALTWDDHEVAPNWGGGQAADPVFAARLAAARQAYYEHLPLRPAARPGPQFRLYRSLTVGDLLRLNITDTRSYRAPGDMLGAAQEAWLTGSLANAGTRWNVTTAQVLMARFDYQPGPGQTFSADKWDGYPESRARLLDTIAVRGVRNPVMLSGDIHVNIFSDLRVDFDDPGSPTVATEFTGAAISSRGTTAEEEAGTRALIAAEMPHVRYFAGYDRGYLLCQLDRQRWRTDVRAVRTEGWRGQVTSPDADVRTLASYVVEDGRPGAVPL
ncbi:alkaline phosphatase [Plantactinospora sp. BB1]|uniref:alkaline phosphatase D family protein n=1 Tax=Plantactinospora sp. BB1 TaxID=2071627 RepID=UPI000D16DE7A|nr:alkaline phosphatase D family protein [Plantactinospora sp. BB1]AVT35426.1 alkaline phosphatase [Plantactinospora sp. BB1]